MAFRRGRCSCFFFFFQAEDGIRDWSVTGVQTCALPISRGRAYVYEPRVTEQDCVAAASGSFVQRVFGGALKPMLVHFIEQRRLTRKEIGRASCRERV